MRTTLDLPDPLMRRIKVKAAQEDRKLKDLVAELLEAGLAQPAKLWMDAWSAAFAVADGCRLVSTDQVFGQFDGLDLLLLADTPGYIRSAPPTGQG